jgi:hypothetical protein
LPDNQLLKSDRWPASHCQSDHAADLLAVADPPQVLTPDRLLSVTNKIRRRRGKAGRSWYVDETFIKVHGQWRYLYRAIDRSGALVDVMFSEHRDMAAAKAFFASAKMVTGVTPDRVTTDGHDSYPRAIRTILGAGGGIAIASISITGWSKIIAVSKPLWPGARVQVPTIGWRILSRLRRVA